jgi:hypothetical protein
MKTKTEWIKWSLATVTLIWIINGVLNAIQNL